LKEETIKYCELDCKILFNVLKNFNKNIFDLFKINVQKYPTLPSLSLGIYRTNFLSEDYKIPLIHGEIYKNIKEGYTGGSVDVFKPYGLNLFSYDFNSLYPFVIKNFPMPVGHPTYFEGDISLKETNPFGIFEVEITSPENCNVPILQHRFKVNN
jgi:DNA polymerase type B, organellar and viral